MHLTLLSIIALLLYSCQSDVARQRDAVEKLIGQEIIIPDSLEWRIQETYIPYDTDRADYKVVCYIDSGGCTSCRMKLMAWNAAINELKAIDETADITFLMILDTADEQLISYLSIRDNFLSPFCLDTEGRFAKANRLPADNSYHTFLLDNDNMVIAVGNPATNPKVRALYRYIIAGNQSETIAHLSEHPTASLGILASGDTIRKSFTICNTLDQPLTVQQIVPSCDCTSATLNSNTILPGQQTNADVVMIADSVSGAFTRHVDIYFNEQEKPERLTLHGYIL